MKVTLKCFIARDCDSIFARTTGNTVRCRFTQSGEKPPNCNCTPHESTGFSNSREIRNARGTHGPWDELCFAEMSRISR